MLKNKFDLSEEIIIPQEDPEADAMDNNASIEFDLNEAIEILDSSENAEEREQAIADIVDCAFSISQKNWDRGCEIIKNNLSKYEYALPDGVIGDIVDIAINDPRLQDFKDVVESVEHSDFKELRNRPEVLGFLPDHSALALMDIAEHYASKGSPILTEVQFIRQKMDPCYDVELQDTFDLH